MEVLSVAISSVLGVGLAVFGWLARRYATSIDSTLKRIEEDVKFKLGELSLRIQRIEDGQKCCQLSLAKDYRMKIDAIDDSNKQWGKIDDHEKRLTRLETLNEKE